MVNLRAAANRLTSGINPNITAMLRTYTGFSVNAAAKATPTYADPVPITVQVQAISKRELQHLDAMNISNCERAVYANVQLQATDRLTQSGGDLLQFEGAVWLVAAILEGWTTAGWCKAALTRQMDAPV